MLKGPGFLRREPGPAGPAFLAGSEGPRVEWWCPGGENVSHPELGLWVQHGGQEKRRRVRADKMEKLLLFSEREPKDYHATESRSPPAAGQVQCLWLTPETK